VDLSRCGITTPYRRAKLRRRSLGIEQEARVAGSTDPKEVVDENFDAGRS
jgi:hypothetical protein